MDEGKGIESYLADCSVDIGNWRKDLFRTRRENFLFVDSEHTSKETKQKIRELNELIVRIDETYEVLRDPRMPSAFKGSVKELSKDCKELYEFSRDINKTLSDDLHERQQIEKGNRTDIAKGLIPIFTVAAAFVTVAKGAGSDVIMIAQAAILGAGVGGGITFNKDIRKLFSDTRKTIADKQIGKQVADTKEHLINAGVVRIEDYREKASAVRARASKRIDETRKAIGWNRKRGL
jgi:hypothetical protein